MAWHGRVALRPARFACFDNSVVST